MTGSNGRVAAPKGVASLFLTATLLIALSLLASVFGGAPRAASKPRAKVEIKIATIAPEGSTWMRIMEQLDAQIREKTAGEAGLRFYPGGVQGDESVVLRKIRAGQLQGGGFTGVGLGEIAPGLRVMEVPFLFRNLEEVRAVQQKMEPTFDTMLRDAGWELLGWSDVGFVYLFTKTPIHTAEDLKKVRMWLWEGDPLAETFLKTVGVSPVPLPITDVVTSLQTGLIDAVYTSALGCIALQWFTRVSYMTDLPVSHAQGAVIVSRKSFELLSPESQKIVKDLAKECFTQLAVETAKEDAASIEVLKNKGIKLVGLSSAETAGFDGVSKTVREKLVGQLYTQELLDSVLRSLDEFRAGKGSPGR
jgi:TRAP-type transport system periplasmic protein